MNKEDKPGYLNIDSSFYQTRLSSKFGNRKPYQPVDPRKVLSFIPGTVLEIFVSVGQQVKKGQVLLIIDAMKMQNRLICSIDSRVKSISVIKGVKVSKGTLLLELE